MNLLPPYRPRHLSSVPRGAVYALCLMGLSLAASGQNLSPISDVAQLTLGRTHACVVTTAGGVKCWGNNRNGELGTGDNENRFIPADVVGLSGGVASVNAGDRHTCAVLTDGSVRCWGDNLLSQLGDGSTRTSNIPVEVSGLTEVTQVAVGGAHTCALGLDTQVRCWGFNGDAQLGTGDTDNRPTPTRVNLLQNVSTVVAGRSNTCIINTNGAVACWGVVDRICSNFGCGFQSFGRPTAVAGLDSDVVTISAGEYFNCAVTSSGGVKCWGDNYDRQLGVQDTFDPDPLELFDIEGLQANVLSVSAGYDHACATLSDGTARCWADNAFGRLGDGSTEDRYPPVPVVDLDDIAQVHAGRTSTCALTHSGNVQCWGSNGAGQLGDSDSWFRLTPTPVPGLQGGVTAIATGDFHSCALLTNGSVQCWGSNNAGQTGTNDPDRQPMPGTVAGLSDVTRISAGGQHSCAVTNAGSALCWGSNEFGQLGVDLPNNQPLPIGVTGLASGVSQIEAGLLHTCATTTAGGATCWGRNIERQLGDASLSNQFTPVDVFGLGSGVRAVSAGDFHSCATTSAGNAECWGDNGDGQLGNGTTDGAFTPVALDFPVRGVTALSAGRTHSCAVVSGGEALCWGDNEDGQLGLGFSQQRLLPERVQGLASGVADISAGQAHTCALTAAGGALCWGNNDAGQLGDATTTTRRGPVPVSGLTSGVAQISAGSLHTCALTTAGAVSCWGSNASDELGLNRRDNRRPGPVLSDPSLFRSGFEASEAL